MKLPVSAWPRSGVVDEILAQRLPDPLHGASVELSDHDERIHDAADVVHRRVTDDLHVTRVGIDLRLRRCGSRSATSVRRLS
jgi:hypothetical protein